MEGLDKPTGPPLRAPKDQARPVLDLRGVSDAPVRAIEQKAALAVLQAPPRFACQQVHVILVGHRGQPRGQHQARLGIQGNVLVDAAEDFGQRHRRRVLGRAGDDRHELRRRARARLPQVTDQRGAERRQARLAQSLIVLAQFPGPVRRVRPGVDRLRLEQVQKRGPRMRRLPTGAHHATGLQFGQGRGLGAPARVQGVVGKRFAKRRQTGLQPFHVLHPQLDPLPGPAAGIHHATQVHRRVMQIAQQHQMPGRGVRSFPHQHTKPQRRTLIGGVDGNGKVALGDSANCARRLAIHAAPFLSMPPPPGKAKTARLATGGAFHFLSADDRKPNKKPLSLNIPAALTGENPGNVEGCSDSQTHPAAGRGSCRDHRGAGAASW